MNEYVKIGLGFITGLVIGAFATAKYIEHQAKKELIEAEEIAEEEQKEYEDCQTMTPEEVEEMSVPSTRESRIDYSKIKTVNDAEYTRLLDELRYNSESDAREILGEDMLYHEDEIDKSKPYYIPSEQFEELDDFESDEYTFYADGYVTDSYGLPVTDEDIERTIGINFDENFDKYQTDQIWIRNERLQMDFSVIRDEDKFVDVAPPRIRRMAGL